MAVAKAIILPVERDEKPVVEVELVPALKVIERDCDAGDEAMTQLVALLVQMHPDGQ